MIQHSSVEVKDQSKTTSTSVGPQGSLHFVPKLEDIVYADLGVNIGYLSSTSETDGSGTSEGGFSIGGGIGVRIAMKGFIFRVAIEGAYAPSLDFKSFTIQTCSFNLQLADALLL